MGTDVLEIGFAAQVRIAAVPCDMCRDEWLDDVPKKCVLIHSNCAEFSEGHPLAFCVDDHWPELLVRAQYAIGRS